MNLKQLTLALTLAGLPSLSFATQVLTTLPVTHSLATALLDGTSVQLKRAAPANLPASRQPSYFSSRGGESLANAAQQADAVIGVRSIWRDDPLYPMARRSNIRIVEIDAARPVDGALPGIAVTGDDAYGAYPWLNPTNLGRMADVVANDLERLSPADKAKIQGNLAGLKRQLLELTASSQTQLAEVDNLTVVSLSERLGYLASGLNLDVVEQALPAEGKWDAAALKALGENLKSQDVALVLDHRQPEPAVAEVIKAAGARLVVVNSDADDAVAGLKASVDQVVGALSES
ncbi:MULTISPECIES: zinc ABC transporter substrate-binding protein [unclassified Pseudomonas]|jgi:ABC-type metal ion transport system, periplasmic component/surface adhesin|uniref:metal ABC transporter substrate-binding protein n=1 Tax=unclassified Pseudomonas TaxID=196821 RepID=UPI000408ACFD|nr:MULTISPECIES: zinc ABC transporter substrate-binding protein [unclassified Pseudomonas]MCX2684772.1 zinc ABC transporter substrate-binding protein [Pseudomonas sp. DCB_AW]SMF25823.1 ABC-type Zn uptake system ZnuABC, Zn-binding component ZnuA [Pseudomonas sp. LAIL14HWK12:I11]SMR74095.1 ABC-type Zn uptake system ZnuABC, Zn-binding component ZnuA [Pseudomonas sp. LAIL14HWK12:I10]SOD03842.1 ABC-type Zn uptake system ZnuABC, Zn-binding component ZnuA [Pseudomonas sp. LAIL14HWK12:I8]